MYPSPTLSPMGTISLFPMSVCLFLFVDPIADPILGAWNMATPI